MQSAVADKIPQLIKVFKQNHIKRAYLFGSAPNGGFNESSDIDLLIDFTENLDPLQKGESWWNAYYALKDLFKRDIDLVVASALRNPVLIEQINKEKELIYEE